MRVIDVRAPSSSAHVHDAAHDPEHDAGHGVVGRAPRTVLAMPLMLPVVAFRRSYRRIRCYSLGIIAVLVPGGLLLAESGRLPRAHPAAWVAAVLGALVLIGIAAGAAQRRQDLRARAWGAGHAWRLHRVALPGEPVREWLPVDVPARAPIATEVMHGLHGERPAVSYTLLWSTEVRLWRKHREVRHTRHVLALALALAAPFAVPPLTVEPRRHAPRGRGAVVVGPDEFDSRFRVRCADRPTALALLRPRTLQRLLAVPTTGIRSLLPVGVTANLRPRLDDATITYTDSWVVATWSAIPDADVSQAALELLVDLVDLVPDRTGGAP